MALDLKRPSTSLFPLHHCSCSICIEVLFLHLGLVFCIQAVVLQWLRIEGNWRWRWRKQGTKRWGEVWGRGMDSNILDDIIARLLEVRTGRPGKQVQLSEAEIRQLCVASKDIFLSQPNLLELEAPIKICGTVLFYSILIAALPYVFAFLTIGKLSS